MLTLYDDPDSGNGYKVRLLLAQLGRDYRLVALDIDKGETRTPEFLAKNPNGRVPALELDDGTVLPESNAILYFLAMDSPFWPEAALDRAQVLRWMFFEQYSHEPNVATSRYWLRHGLVTEDRRPLLAEKQANGRAALQVMEDHLAGRDFLVAGRYTIADIALYAYTHVADQGGIPLDPYPAVRAWLGRVEAQPGYVTLDSAPTGA